MKYPCDTIQLVRRSQRETAAGAASYTLESLREAEDEIAELLGRAAT